MKKGDIAPDFTLQTTEGELVNLAGASVFGINSDSEFVARQFKK